jgi:hypothetical protein
VLGTRVVSPAAQRQASPDLRDLGTTPLLAALGAAPESGYAWVMAEATAADRAHFLRIAEASAELESDRQKMAASEDPATKIEEALRLSNMLVRRIAVQPEPEPARFSLIERWRNLQTKAGSDGNRR